MSEYVFRKKLLKRIKCQNGHIVRFHNNSVEIKVQYSSNPRKLSSKVHNLVGRAVTVPTPSVPGNSPGRWVWWSDQRGSGMPFYWTVYPTCLSETLVFQYTSREILRQEESYKVRNVELEERLRILCIFPAIHVFVLFLSKLFACLTWSIKMRNECVIFSMTKNNLYWKDFLVGLVQKSYLDNVQIGFILHPSVKQLHGLVCTVLDVIVAGSPNNVGP